MGTGGNGASFAYENGYINDETVTTNAEQSHMENSVKCFAFSH